MVENLIILLCDCKQIIFFKNVKASTFYNSNDQFLIYNILLIKGNKYYNIILNK